MNSKQKKLIAIIFLYLIVSAAVLILYKNDMLPNLPESDSIAPSREEPASSYSANGESADASSRPTTEPTISIAEVTDTPVETDAVSDDELTPEDADVPAGTDDVAGDGLTPEDADVPAGTDGVAGDGLTPEDADAPAGTDDIAGNELTPEDADAPAETDDGVGDELTPEDADAPAGTDDGVGDGLTPEDTNTPGETDDVAGDELTPEDADAPVETDDVAGDGLTLEDADAPAGTDDSIDDEMVDDTDIVGDPELDYTDDGSDIYDDYASIDDFFIVYNIKDNLNVRSGPSKSSDKIGELPADSYGDVLEVGTEFTKISYDGLVGYVSNDYIKIGNDAWNLIEKMLSEQVYITSGCSIRNKASMNSTVIGHAKSGTTYPVDHSKCVSSWNAIILEDNTVAYVSSLYSEIR